MKKLDLYTYVYNDADFLPFFLDYYSFVDRITFIDSGSTDRTMSLIHKFATKEHPVIRIIQTGLTWWDHNMLHELRNIIWKGSEYDLVFFPDCDEIFYHPDLRDFIERTNYDVYEMEGFEMISPKMPKIGTKITDIKTGTLFKVYNKSTIFNPRINITFPNAHKRETSSQNISRGEIKLLHYRRLSLPMMIKRRDRIEKRTPKGYIRLMNDSQIKEEYFRMLNESTIVI